MRHEPSVSENEPDLLGRSIRTLAWIGDAHFERELRLRLAGQGDFPTQRLDRARAMVASAKGQAALLATIEDELDDDESAIVRRGRNAELSGGGRAQRDIKAYRAATGLEALVAFWALRGQAGRDRFEAVLAPPLERAIEQAIARSRAPRRG
jgi:ribonuclease-3 family protein